MREGKAKIVVTSFRHRLVDVDGISVKAAIDGLVHAGVLEDDGPDFVREVILRQRKSSKERTVIKITWS